MVTLENYSRLNSPSSSLNGSILVYKNDPILEYCNIPETVNYFDILYLYSIVLCWK